MIHQDLNLHPNQGYTLGQVEALYDRFDLAIWALEEDLDLTRFVYLNMPRFFPHAIIQRAESVSELETAPDPKMGKIKADTHAGAKTLDEWTDDHLDACIVIQEGKILYEKYPRMRSQDKHLWWSISKTFAGTLVGLLEEKGLVDVQMPVETYLPELGDSDWKGTPVIDILDMASGMEGLEADDPEAYTNPESPYGLFEASLGYQPTTPNTMESTYEYIATLKRQKESGKRDEYTSVNTFVLSWLVEKLLDKPYAEIVSETFWQKIGAETDAMIGVSSIGAPGSSGLVSSTLRDLARYGMLYTPSWNKVSEEKVIPDSLIKRIQEDGRPSLFQAGLASETWGEYMGEDAIFGTRQFDFVTKDGDFAKTGYHGQTLYISPSKDLVVASFATGELYDTYRFARVIATA
jgi:CubicO group peptidase (beta-lactamase class C family)